MTQSETPNRGQIMTQLLADFDATSGDDFAGFRDGQGDEFQTVGPASAELKRIVTFYHACVREQHQFAQEQNPKIIAGTLGDIEYAAVQRTAKTLDDKCRFVFGWVLSEARAAYRERIPADGQIGITDGGEVGYFVRSEPEVTIHVVPLGVAGLDSELLDVLLGASRGFGRNGQPRH